MAAAGEPIRFVLDWGPRYALSIVNLGLACCAIEFVAASMRAGGLRRADSVATPLGQAHVLVVSGTVSDKLAPSVLRWYGALPEPRFVLSFGACSNSGGPYWDSYAVTKGVDQLVPVDVYVPGCPPRPEALLQGLRQLHERLDPPARPLAVPSVLGGRPAPADLRRPL